MMGLDAIERFYFAWPWALAALGLLPLYWLIYRQIQCRQLQQGFAFSRVALLQQLKIAVPGWQRLLQPVLLTGVMALLVLAMARPTVSGRVAVQTVDMMLVMDISLSMLARDIRPDRMQAARQASIAFVKRLPEQARVGLTFFAGDSYVVSPPTRDHGQVIRYLQALRKEDLQPRTEIGSAIQAALQSLSMAGQSPRPAGQNPQNPRRAQPPRPQRVIVLLSDGDSREGYPWEEAARNARRQNVRIYTVGIGSLAPTAIEYQGQILPVAFDERVLRQIAGLSDGQFFRVFRQGDFQTIYNQVREKTLVIETQTLDLAFVASGLALLLLFLAMGPLRWLLRSSI